MKQSKPTIKLVLKYRETEGIIGDYDSDSILLTDNQMFIEAAQKNYDKFKVPTCFVSAKKIKRYYTNEQKADLDVKTSVNKIGEDINLSQQLNSLFWQHIYNGETFEDNAELYYDICKLAVLSGIEIDKAKKEYEVDVCKELNQIKEKQKITELVKDKNGETPEKVVKPMFFKMITIENGYDISERHLYKYFDTPMDYLQKRLSKFQFRLGRKQKQDILPFSSIVKKTIIPNDNGYYYRQMKRIIDIVRDTNKELRNLYKDYEEKTKEEKEEVKSIASEIKQTCVEYVNDISMHNATMYLLLTALDKKENRDVKRRIFLTLFGTPNKTFFTMISDNQGIINELYECNDGNITLYDLKYNIK